MSSCLKLLLLFLCDAPVNFCFLSRHFRTKPSILFGLFGAFDRALKITGKFARGHRNDNKSKKVKAFLEFRPL